MKSLFEPSSKEEIISRIAKLSGQHVPLWGKMSVSQMLHHCQFPLKLAIKNDPKGSKPNFLARLFFKKMMYNDRLWRKNLPTVPKFKVVEDKDFNSEKKLLLELIEEFSSKSDKINWNPHPMFGKFSPEQWGKIQYKHLDHHLRQFGV